MKFRLRIILSIILTLIGSSVIIWLLLRGYFVEKFINPNELINLDNASKIGDFIGGFTGALFTLTGVILLYETLAFQRRELAESRRVFEKQQFDNSFFELLRLYNDIIGKISFKESRKIYRGRDFFKLYKEKLQEQFRPKKVLSFNRKNATALFEKFYVEHHDSLSVYFRTLYRLYSLIDESIIKESEKATYSKILRAQLSESELFFLRYNGMTEIGRKSSFFINKYNLLKHLSHFDLLEYKDWWSKLNDFEKNGIGYIFIELKSYLQDFINDPEYSEFSKGFKNNRYVLQVSSQEYNYFEILIIKDDSKSSRKKDMTDGLEKFTNKEIENLLECLIKDFVILSNFNAYNERKELDFYSDTSISNTKTNIKVGVKNKIGNPLIVKFPHGIA